MKTIDTSLYNTYHITGTLVSGKRFKSQYAEPRYAFGINLYRGSVWGIRKDNGKRQLLKRVWN